MNLNTFLEAKSTELRNQYITFVIDADARSSDCTIHGEQHGSARFAVVVAVGAPVVLQLVRPKVMTAAARHGSAGTSFYSPSLVCANNLSLSLSLQLSLTETNICGRKFVAILIPLRLLQLCYYHTIASVKLTHGSVKSSPKIACYEVTSIDQEGDRGGGV